MTNKLSYIMTMVLIYKTINDNSKHRINMYMCMGWVGLWTLIHFDKSV